MKFSEQWLREIVNPAIDTAALSEQLTMAGLEVDGIEPVCASAGVVVAKIKSVKKHPNADRLQICEVDCGDATSLNIICGAANVRAGLTTVLARVGAKLSENPPLKAISLKGIESQGMLCSFKEIGLGDDNDGIIELSGDEIPGQILAELIDIDDHIITISLTPNRGDCLNIRGIAREVAINNGLDYDDLKDQIQAVPITTTAQRQIKIISDQACPRYLGRVIEAVNTKKQSPLWLVERLRRSGIRSINIVVDIMNYVMLELGQPLHAFDNDRLEGEIVVCQAQGHEQIKLLDGSEKTLIKETLLITDQHGAVAIAGIMGGFDSATTTATQNIFLESAWFSPEAIMGRARQYGLQTDASYRFERGVDPELQRAAIERASQLILQFCGGRAGAINEIVNTASLPQHTAIVLQAEQIKRILGISLAENFITTTFKRSGMNVENNKNQLLIKQPSWRFDIKIAADLIEELARIYRYDEIPPCVMSDSLKLAPLNLKQQTLATIQDILINRGYQEVINYSFIDPKLNQCFKHKAIRLANPINATLSEMRVSLLPGLLNTLQYNLNRQQERVRLFETGLVFRQDHELQQDHYIGGLIYGNKYKKQWDIENISSNLYDIISDVETILGATISKDRFEIVKIDHNQFDFLYPHRSLELNLDGQAIGYLGALHPDVSVAFDLAYKDIYVFEIKTENIISKQQAVQYQAISRFPLVTRELSMLFDQSTAYQQIADHIQALVSEAVSKDHPDLFMDLELFDLYQKEGIEKSKKSLTFNLTFQATSSTLRDKEIEIIMEKIIDGLHNTFGAKLRT